MVLNRDLICICVWWCVQDREHSLRAAAEPQRLQGQPTPGSDRPRLSTLSQRGAFEQNVADGEAVGAHLSPIGCWPSESSRQAGRLATPGSEAPGSLLLLRSPREPRSLSSSGSGLVPIPGTSWDCHHMHTSGRSDSRHPLLPCLPPLCRWESLGWGHVCLTTWGLPGMGFQVKQDSQVQLNFRPNASLFTVCPRQSRGGG